MGQALPYSACPCFACASLACLEPREAPGFTGLSPLAPREARMHASQGGTHMVQTTIDLPAVIRACAPELEEAQRRARCKSLAPTVLVFGLAFFLIAQVIVGA